MDEGLRQLEEANTLLPLDKSTYEGLANGYFAAGRFYLEQANQAQQGTSAQDVQKWSNRVRAIWNRRWTCPNASRTAWPAFLKISCNCGPAGEIRSSQVTPTVDQNAGMADVLLGHYQEADGYLQASLSDNSLKATSQLWEGISLQQQGKTSQGQQLIDQATKSDQSLASELPQIKALLPK